MADENLIANIEKKPVNSRRTAAFIIAKWLLTKDFPSNMFPEGRDRAFVQDLVYTVVRRMRALRKILSFLVAKWPKGELEALLYVGAAQIFYMKDVPDFAAVNETVEAAKTCENKSIPKVVNGVLRNCLRRRDELEKMIASSSVDVRESFPRELYRRWVRRFGADNAEKLAVWHNMPAETFLAWKDGRIEKLERGKKVEEQPGFKEGEFIVQDPATKIAVSLLDVVAGEKILDACAAPGGKSIQIAWRGAALTSCEINPKRRRKLVENLKRVGLEDKVEVLSELPSSSSRLFDKVLVDAPCSNTGVLRRRPDARWNWNEEKLSALVRLQSDILDVCANLVRPGGQLVYSTCSNEEDENSLQVRRFIERRKDFSLSQERERIPALEEGEGDGAYSAVLVKAP